MIRILFGIAFLLGALAIAWIGNIFLGADALGLGVTLVIGAVYLIGTWELMLFRRATSRLHGVLSDLNEPVEDLSSWLATVDASLQNAVRLRVDGERNGLPAPVVTPYLVGLLVMLGLLGTFVGMVDTLNGAVVALEGDSELEAIREGLAAPIEGLGLAFGTSVAGVAASAMLGLLSTISRRERLQVSHFLDTKVATHLQAFSVKYRQQLVFNAIEDQASALPAVAEKLSKLSDNLEKMTQDLSQNLVSSQAEFQTTVAQSYKALGESVDKSLKESLVENTELIHNNITPMTDRALAQLNESAVATHTKLSESSQAQLEAIDGAVQANAEVIRELLNDNIQPMAAKTLTQLSDSASSTQQELIQSNKDQLAAINGAVQSNSELLRELVSESIQPMTEKTLAVLSDGASATQKQLSESSEGQLAAINGAVQSNSELLRELVSDSIQPMAEKTLAALSDGASATQKQLSESNEGQLAAINAAVQSNAASIRELIDVGLEQQQASATKMVDGVGSSVSQVTADLQQSSQALLSGFSKTNEQFSESQKQQAAEFSVLISDQLKQQREEQSKQTNEAIARLTELEKVVTEHLATLGAGLEEPMTRLIETATKTPEAAAQVIEQMRDEASKNVIKGNDLLAERIGLIERLDALTDSLESSAQNQQQSIALLVENSTEKLNQVSNKFGEHLDGEMSKLVNAADYFASSSVEMTSLSEGFNVAVGLFSESNQSLIENLTRIETALKQSNDRSDEQLNYYVTQAREIIDHNLLSHKEILDALGQKALGNGGA